MSALAKAPIKNKFIALNEFMLLLDGKRLTKGKAFNSNGVSYPANWLELTSREQHEEIGIVYAADPAPTATWDPARLGIP